MKFTTAQLLAAIAAARAASTEKCITIGEVVA